MIWLLPAAVAGAALVPVVALVLRVAAEVAVLRAELSRMAEVRAAVVDLRSDAQVVRANLRRRASGR